MQDLYTRNLPGALLAIQQAQLAIQAGNQAEALKYLGQAKASLLAAQLTLASHVQPTYINASCPMMGSRIDPEKVTPDLTRQFNGQSVGFCCAGCPQAWDKLSPAEKEAKLKKVLSVTQQDAPAAPKTTSGAS
ncbi:MAG: hypothetical protein JW810_14450 [Sedimentisphaerales bacterium]|nr:hypothetical protein [Sedimentisphaerales bacterium]